MLRPRISLSVLLLAFLLSPLQTAAIKFALPASKNPIRKCIWNAAHDGALVVITANLGPGENQRIDVDVVDRSEHQHMYLSKKGLKSETRVAITAHGEGDVGICFTNTLVGSVISADQARVIDLDVDIGADAVDYNAIANQESLSGLETEMRKLEAVVQEITDEFGYLKRREMRMRDTNVREYACSVSAKGRGTKAAIALSSTTLFIASRPPLVVVVALYLSISLALYPFLPSSPRPPTPMYHGIPFTLLGKRCELSVDACPTPVCNCKADESCQIIFRTCDQCDKVICTPNSRPASGSISEGAVAGAVVSCVVVTALLAAMLWFLRRRRAARKAAQVIAAKRATPYTVEGGPTGTPVGTPAGEKPPTLLSTPASPRTPNANANGTSHTLHYAASDINLDPFADALSVRSGNSSHVIPIAYVPPNSASMSLADGHRQSVTSLPPSRPHRSPDLNLKLEPPKSAASRLSVGQDLRPPRFSSPYAASQRSGASRASTISSVGSFMYSDTPVVVSQAQGGVRQVLGVARPAVVQVPAAGLSSGPPTPGSGTGADLIRSFSQRSKKSAGIVPPLPEFPPEHIAERSPFSPESEGGDPFADKENETASYSVRSVNTFGQPGVPGRDIRASKSPVQPNSTTFLAEPVGYDSRPSSIGTVIEGEAHRVVLGTASASEEDINTLPPVPVRRTSGASVADSILAGFPFVPPSPVGQGAESTNLRPGSLAMSVSESLADHNPPPVPPVPTLSELARQEEEALEQGQVARLPPSRHTLGMSTFSSASGVSSSGLEAFPFQFGPAGGAPRDSLDTNVDVDLGAVGGKQIVRASLDTLALSRDVEAFPLPESGYTVKRS
ncbi:emp24/gp25L/p24 family/GOLD [Rhizoctonia solani]|uniref:Emp24/gp25L/p24 family/GOLD n=1 Tax=Rhizoctonia solani TaxID=456999 RepID=A0A8H7LHN3_9AGAM|nr:emp24/gp25L/p24 family/GOLD [Rhizoctonia solani]